MLANMESEGNYSSRRDSLRRKEPSWLFWTFVFARVWLRRHWVGADSYSPFKASLSNGGQSTDSNDPRNAPRQPTDDPWSGLAQSMLDLKIGRVNISGWRALMSNFPNYGFSDRNVDHRQHESPVPQEMSDTKKLFWDEMASAEQEASLLREALDAQYTSMNLRETQRGIMLTEQSLYNANIVGRLTQVAFIFLPLTFITGVFGMNIRP